MKNIIFHIHDLDTRFEALQNIGNILDSFLNFFLKNQYWNEFAYFYCILKLEKYFLLDLKDHS